MKCLSPKLAEISTKFLRFLKYFEVQKFKIFTKFCEISRNATFENGPKLYRDFARFTETDLNFAIQRFRVSVGSLN